MWISEKCVLSSANPTEYSECKNPFRLHSVRRNVVVVAGTVAVDTNVSPGLPLLLLLVVAQQSVPLLRLASHLALAGSLGLRTLGVHLLLQLSLAGLLGLGAVDLDETTNVSITVEPRISANIREMGRIRTCSTRARLCLKVLPLAAWYSSWYRCLSILPEARYLTKRRRRTR